jgi:hypothetical protein
MEIGIALVAVFGVLLVIVALQPAQFTMERSLQMTAPAEAIFPLLNDFHRWTRWSPWDGLDPAMQRTYQGTSGPGSSYAWESRHKKVGAGRMTLTAEEVNAWVEVKLEFLAPFPATNEVRIAIAPAEGGSRVTWRMTGHKNFMTKAFHLMMNMDKLIGPDFEKGLAAIKVIAESGKSAA